MSDQQARTEISEEGESSAGSAGASNFADFEILEQVASGGMGTIYKVRQKNFQRICAMKVLNFQEDTSGAAVKRFVNESKIVCSLDHPNIVKMFATGFNENGKLFFAMEWLEGYSLDRILTGQGKLKIQDFRSIFGQVLEAIIYAHGQGILHRDLKPGNIFITESNSLTTPPVVKLLDFGIARRIEQVGGDAAKLTRTGVILGSPVYMSPEQSRCEELGKSSDIYSLGVIMYECLVGKPPFVGETALDTMYKHVNEIPDASELAKASEFDGINQCVLKCLSKNPAERYVSAEELLVSLKESWNSKRSSRLQIVPAAIATVLIVIAIAVVMPFLHKNPGTTESASANKDDLEFSMKPRPLELMTIAKGAIRKSETLKESGAGAAAEKEMRKATKLYEKAVQVSQETVNQLRNKWDELQSGLSSHSERRVIDEKLNNETNTLFNAVMELGELYEKEGKLDKACNNYLYAARDIMKNYYELRAQAERAAARAMEKSGKINEAIDELKLIINMPLAQNELEGTKDADLWEKSNCEAQLGRLLLKANHFEESNKYFRAALNDFKPNDAYVIKLMITNPASHVEMLLGISRTTKDKAEADHCLADANNILISVASKHEHPSNSIRALAEQIQNRLSREQYDRLRTLCIESIELSQARRNPEEVSNLRWAERIYAK